MLVWLREASLEENEVQCMGAAIVRGFENTKELHVMKYNQAINQGTPEECTAWKQTVKEEYEWMVKHLMFKVTPHDKVPEDVTVLTSTWVMKKKANGTHRACLNARGFEQIDREHYDEDSKFALDMCQKQLYMSYLILSLWQDGTPSYLMRKEHSYITSESAKTRFSRKSEGFFLKFRIFYHKSEQLLSPQ
jgi:hypothetical protein